MKTARQSRITSPAKGPQPGVRTGKTLRLKLRSPRPGQRPAKLTMRDLLERSGFRICNAKRADCAHCAGNSTATVSYTDEVAYCHRCHWTANAVTLACQLGLAKPVNQWTPAERRSEQQRREREARVRAFEAWLKAKTHEVMDELAWTWPWPSAPMRLRAAPRAAATARPAPLR